MKDYKGKPIVIIGLGVTGLSCVNFFCSRNIIPRVMDTRLSPPGLDKLPTHIEYYLGGLNQQWLLESTLIVTSPGLPLSHPALVLAEKSGVEIIGDIELFAREATAAPLVAITGSNGKSTVTRMVEAMGICAGWKVGVGGNIGLPALRLLEEACQLYILELSSFQLETTYSLHATATTILNISEDHIDRYPLGLQQYRAAKLKIYQNSKVCVVNANDLLTIPVERLDDNCVSFGTESSTSSSRISDYCLTDRNGQTWLMAYNKPILNCSEMPIRGRHNYTNALSALALADAVKIPRPAILVALRKFRGLSHRFELVHECHGVRWINDSKSTNVGSTIAALNGLHVTGGSRLHLLLGGDGKSVDFSPLSPWVQGDHIRIYCFGKNREQLAMLRDEDATLTETLEQAIRIIGSQVRKGDLVLLSPACSSLDQFSNFEIRGDVFTQLAQEVG